MFYETWLIIIGWDSVTSQDLQDHESLMPLQQKASLHLKAFLLHGSRTLDTMVSKLEAQRVAEGKNILSDISCSQRVKLNRIWRAYNLECFRCVQLCSVHRLFSSPANICCAVIAVWRYKMFAKCLCAKEELRQKTQNGNSFHLFCRWCLFKISVFTWSDETNYQPTFVLFFVHWGLKIKSC